MSLKFDSRIFCLITGASRGIGQKIAQIFAQKSAKITFLLIARSAPGLEETKQLILKINPNALITCISMDLVEARASAFQQALSGFDMSVYDTAVVFHNAGQIGTIDKASTLSDELTWKNYYSLNMFSVTVLNSIFLTYVKNVTHVFVINITSLVGRKPFKYLSMYGSAKSARDMYFKVLALEEPQIKVLNYSPGMVETSMSSELLKNIGKYEDSGISGDGGALTTEQTTNKLFELLASCKFASGDIVDYYD